MRAPGAVQLQQARCASPAALGTLLHLLVVAALGAMAAAGDAADATGSGMPGGMVTVFAAECNDYMTWQSIAVVYTHRKMGVPGPIIRILTCDEQALKQYPGVDVVPTHVSPSWTYDKRNNDAYLAYNKPGALIDWLRKAPPKEEWVLVMDPDMVIRDSFTDWGRVYGADRGWAVSLYFGYMRGVANNLSATHIPEVQPCTDSLAGPRGRRSDMASGVVLMHREDLKHVAPLWLHYSEAVRDDPLGYKETGDEYAKHPGQKPWISEMYGYSFGAAKAGVWHRVDYHAQLYPGYQAFDKPLILHYGRMWELTPARGPAWRYQKHWFNSFKATQCPPWPHLGMELTGPEAALKVPGGLFPPPPHPAEFGVSAWSVPGAPVPAAARVDPGTRSLRPCTACMHGLLCVLCLPSPAAPAAADDHSLAWGGMLLTHRATLRLHTFRTVQPLEQRYKELLSIQVIATVNAALCERHLAKCPPSRELTDQCGKVKQLERDVDDAILEVERRPGICTDRKPTPECRNWAARRLCWQDTGFMHNWCRATCGLCRLPSGQRQVAWNESLSAVGAHTAWQQKQRGGRKEQLPHWTEQLHTAEVHRMHTDRGRSDQEADEGSALTGRSSSILFKGGSSGRTVLGFGSSGGGSLLYAAVSGWALALGLLAGWVLRGVLRYHQRQHSAACGMSRLPVAKPGRPRASTALLY
ncbi:hypothetical protein ABPG77_003697 [Micractinium sp. CCAP 211/92]